MATKYVYIFSEGNANMRELLGGKGANLAEMTNLGMPVPQGFTVTTEACTQYYNDGRAIRAETVIDAIVEACGILDQKEAVMRAGGDPLTVGGAATWDGGVELGEDGFVAVTGAGDTPAGTPAAPVAAKEAE